EGTQQSGVLDLKLADLAQDQQILQVARSSVIEIFEKDPDLTSPDHELLLRHFSEKDPGISWNKIS
ncbi:MAG TPA: hypothetical protein VGE15_04565, partial [Sphingobacteriaceae bacterium]